MSHLFFCLVGKRGRAPMQYSNPAPRIFCCSCWDKKPQPPVQQLHFILIRDENVFIAAFSLWEGIYLGKKHAINSWYPCLTHKHILSYILCAFFTRGFGTQLVQMAFYVAFSKYPGLVFLIELCVFQSCHLCKHWNWLFKFFFSTLDISENILIFHCPLFSCLCWQLLSRADWYLWCYISTASHLSLHNTWQARMWPALKTQRFQRFFLHPHIKPKGTE